MLSSLQRCGYHWIPEDKTFDWLWGFLQCLEVCQGIQELFIETKQAEAHEILRSRLQQELAKFATKQETSMTDMPQLTHGQATEIAQLHESFLTELEGLAIIAIASGDWTQFEQFVNDFRASRQDVETNPNEDPLAELWAIAFSKEPS